MKNIYDEIRNLITETQSKYDEDTDHDDIVRFGLMLAYQIVNKAERECEDVPDINVGDTISRQAAIDAMVKIEQDDIEQYGCAIPEGFDSSPAIEALKDLPSAQPRTGHWITKPHVYGVTYCSECDFELKIDNTNYCPSCGADMRGEQDG